MPKDAKNNNKQEKKVKEVKEKKHFLKDVKAELKKVIWPTSKQLINNTLAVIAIVLVISAIVFVLDVCFEKVNTFGIKKLQSVVMKVDNNVINNNTINNNDIINVEGNSVSAENTIENNAQ